MASTIILDCRGNKGKRAIMAPTILISDDSDIQTAVNAIRAGAADFIERPFIDRILLRRVQAALETSEQT